MSNMHKTSNSGKFLLRKYGFLYLCSLYIYIYSFFRGLFSAAKIVLLEVGVFTKQFINWPKVAIRLVAASLIDPTLLGQGIISQGN